MLLNDDIKALNSVLDTFDYILGNLDDVDGSIGIAQQKIENVISTHECDMKNMVKHYSKYAFNESDSKATVIESDGTLVTLMA